MQYNGLVDNRTEEEKKLDFLADEILAQGSIIFEQREPVSYTPRNQDGSGSCVAQTTAKMLEIWDFKHDKELTVYSATPIYKARSNKPQPGMNAVEALSYPIKNGAHLENDVPSQMMGDQQMDDADIPAVHLNLRPNAYLFLSQDFYKVAEAIKTFGAVMLWFKCSYEEWSRDIPEGGSDSEAVRHSVTAVDIISYMGEEYIIIEDSWGTWLKLQGAPLKAGQRAISKKFFDKHCFLAAVYTKFDYEGGVKPKYTFKYGISYGKRGYDVKKLQEMLKYEKFFPSNQEITGYCGSITLRALRSWQVKHGIMVFANEKNITKVRFGTLSIAEANKLYS